MNTDYANNVKSLIEAALKAYGVLAVLDPNDPATDELGAAILRLMPVTKPDQPDNTEGTCT